MTLAVLKNRKYAKPKIRFRVAEFENSAARGEEEPSESIIDYFGKTSGMTV